MYITEYIADCLIPVKQMDWVKVDNSIVSHIAKTIKNVKIIFCNDCFLKNCCNYFGSTQLSFQSGGLNLGVGTVTLDWSTEVSLLFVFIMFVDSP